MDTRSLRLYAERATANVGQAGPLWWLIATVLAAFVAFGAYAYAVQVRDGHAVTGVSHTVFWGFYVVNFVFFIGISYGGAITSAILRLTHAKWRAPISRIAEGTALVTLLVGAASVLVDVGRPDRIPYLFIYAQPGSPITWDWIAINTYLVGTIIFFLLPLIPDVASYRATARPEGLFGRIYGALSFRWSGAPAQEKALLRGIGIMAVLIIPLAVSVHSVLAWLFAVTVQSGWHSTIFAPLFVLAAMLSGVATVILVIAVSRKAYGLHEFITEKHFRYLTYLLVALDAAYLYFMFSEYLTEGYMQEEPMGHVLQLFLSGAYASWFWPFVLGGLLLPIALVTIPGPAFIGRAVVASVLVVLGMWVKRFLIVILPGVAQPLMPWEVYKPTWVELGITLGLLAAIPLGLMILFAIFPVMSVHEMEEVEGVAFPVPAMPQTVTPTAMPAGTSRPWRRGLSLAGVSVAVLAVAVVLAGGPSRVASAVSGSRVSLQAPQTSLGGAPAVTVPNAPGASSAPAASTATGAALSATVAVAPADDAERGYVVQTRVLAEGKPANLVAVRFYEIVDLLGEREMLIGSATTDGQGRASVVYLPIDTGRHNVLVRTEGQGKLAAGQGSVSYEATTSAPQIYWREQLPLARFSLNLPLVAAGALLLVWALFAFALVGTVRSIAAGAREAIAFPRASRGVAAQARLER